MSESLQARSGRESVSRGTTIVVPAGTVDGPRTIGRTLRVDAGTWTISCARLVLGPLGLEVAAAPSATDPDWPMMLMLRHGRGAAGWAEVIPATARGTHLVRTDDLLEVGVGYAGQAPLVADETVLLTVAQAIVSLMPCVVTTRQLASVGGKALHAVPVGAASAQFLGPLPTNAIWTDINGNTLANADPTALLMGTARVPSTAAFVEVGGLPPAAPTTITWEVFG